MLGFTQNKWVFLLLANLLMLFVGCFIDTIAAITDSGADPAADRLKLGIDPVHFGLIMTLNLMIGLLHPPLGMVLFVLARVAKLSVERTTMAILPWLVPLLGGARDHHLRAGRSRCGCRVLDANEPRSSASRSCRSTWRRRSSAPTRSRPSSRRRRRSCASCADGAGHRLYVHDRHRRLVGGDADARPPRAAR